MRSILWLGILAFAPLATGCTVVNHMHLEYGQSRVPYRDARFRSAIAVGAGFALDALPTLSFQLTNTFVHPKDSADYIEPKCILPGSLPRSDVCRPHIISNSTAFEVQKRWEPRRSVHALASASLGEVTTGNQYNPRGCCTGAVTDSVRRTSFVSLGGGGEVSLARALHVNVMAGYRGIVGSERASPSGFTLSAMLVIGQPYR